MRHGGYPIEIRPVNIKLKRFSKNIKKILGQNINCSEFSGVLKFVFKLYILANMTDICPIVVDIQISRLESIF